jgi:small-conductance mechanosensitive channel
MPFWHRIAIAAGVFLLVSILARIVDWRLKRRPLAPQAETRYLVLRRAVAVTILVVGFASQQVLSNFMAGLVIALTQPVRIGDRVSYGGVDGTVEEIAMTYTFIRTLDRRRLVVPNSKLASDAIVNSSIRSRETFAEVTIPLPLAADLDAALAALRDEVAGESEGDAYLDGLDGTATVVLRALAPDELAAERLEQELRLRAHRRLRELGVWSG